MPQKIIALVPAAGSGARFGPGTSKSFALLLDTPVLIWTLKTLAASEEVAEIIPILKEPDMPLSLKLIEEHGILKVNRVVPGGGERHDSVLNGLKQIEDEDVKVLIHDGVRPLLDTSLIRDVIKGLEGYDGCVCALPPKDTIKELRDDGTISSTPPRERLAAVQTPQIFGYTTIMEAYERARAEGFRSTDDAALVERAGGSVNVVEGSYHNIKITTPEDILVAEMFLEQRGQ
jgi:2-C-methyl-D-erythritol 4-phosphate cytidylyltransferase